MARLGLGYLVRMVDGDVVDAARVDVELLAQVLHAHGRALDVPARIASAPGTVPDQGLVLELGLREPEGEVGGIALVASTSMRAPAFSSSSLRRASSP